MHILVTERDGNLHGRVHAADRLAAAARRATGCMRPHCAHEYVVVDKTASPHIVEAAAAYRVDSACADRAVWNRRSRGFHFLPPCAALRNLGAAARDGICPADRRDCRPVGR